jgi:hypothetical protein
VGRIPHILGEELNSLAEEVKLSKKCSLDVREILYLSCIIISLDAWEEASKFRTK